MPDFKPPLGPTQQPHPATSAAWLVCPECGLAQIAPRLTAGKSLDCMRCGARLRTAVRRRLPLLLPLALAAAIAFLLANLFPIVRVEIGSTPSSTTLLGAAAALIDQGMVLVALLVAATTVAAPALQIANRVLLGWALRRSVAPRWMIRAVRLEAALRGWAMVEVALLGVIVALGKLGELAIIEPGIGLWSLVALVVLNAAGTECFDGFEFWDAVQPQAPAGQVPAAAVAAPVAGAALGCTVCGQVSRQPAIAGAGAAWLAQHGQRLQCPRCGAMLVPREPGSFQRTAACVAAAAILYIPANLLPMLESRTLFGRDSDTIMSGIISLWVAGSQGLAILVFFASLMVPLMKLFALTLLLYTVYRGSTWRQRDRTRLFRAIEYIGRWSMLDVYVVALLVALVQSRSLAELRPGMGVLAFAAVVVLTIVASRSFDPRLIWDARAAPRARPLPRPPRRRPVPGAQAARPVVHARPAEKTAQAAQAAP